MKTYEILFQNENVTIEKWNDLIQNLSFYHRFHAWKLFLQVDGNQVHFFVQTKYKLHPVMNGLPFFCFQEQSFLIQKKYQSVFATILWNNASFLEFYDQFTLKKKKQILFFEFQFFLIKREKIWSRSYLYYEKEGFFCKSKLHFLSVASFLAFDSSFVNRFVFKKIPKYWNIQKHLDLFQEDKKNAAFEVFTFPYQEQNSFFTIEQYDFFKHSFVLGGSGTGKSKFLSSFVENILNDEELKQQYKVIMIDPHASMEREIGGFSNTSVIDFFSDKTSIDLFTNHTKDMISEIELYLSLFQMLMSDVYNSKLERVLRFSLELLLTIQKFSFAHLRSLLLDTTKRTEYIELARTKECERIVTFFLQDFYDIKTKYYGEAIAPIIAFLDEIQSVPVFQNEARSHSFKTLISEHFCTLISLDRNKLGDRITKTIAGFLMCQLFQIIQHSNFGEHLIFIVDEVALVENPILCRFLSEARKYNVSLILVSQYFNQISSNLQNAILANVVNYYLFRMSFLDAEMFVKNLNMAISGVKTIEEQMKILMELPHREGIFRLQRNGKFLPSMKIRTLDFESVPYKRILDLDEEKKPKNQKKFSFQFGAFYSLKDFLKTVSTSHKKVRDRYE